MARMMLLVNNRCNRIEVFLRVSLRIFQINEKVHQGMTKIINVKRQFLFFSFSRTFPRCASYSTKYSHQSAVGSLMKQDMQNLPVRFFYSHWQEIWQAKSFTSLPYFKLISCFIENMAFCQKQEQKSYRYRLVLDRLP